MYMPPPLTTAASFVPSDEDVIDHQFNDGADVEDHDVPPLVLMYMPFPSTAASFKPSDEDVIQNHVNVHPEPYQTNHQD